MSDRCTGHCCRHFPMSTSLENIQASARAEVAGKDRFVEMTPEGPRESGLLQDSAVVAEMLIPLGLFSASPTTGKSLDPPQPYFTCRHLSSTGDCMNYERRPRVCSEYPYRGDVCEHASCTWEDARDRKRLTVIQAGTIDLLPLLAVCSDNRSS